MIEIYDAENVILNEIEDKSFKQVDVAKTYFLIMRSDVDVDWATINRAIIRRWSVSGLERIKQLAWSRKCFEDEN
jgi:hypothetical protein